MSEPAEQPCKHGHVGYCGLCAADAAPKCEHGIAFYCGFCGPVAVPAER